MGQMNERVRMVVTEQAEAFYEGTASSTEAYAAIDACALHWANDYPGIVNDTRVLFDTLVDGLISRDVDDQRTLNYAAKEMVDQLRRGTQPDEDFFRVQVTGNGSTRWVNITPEQLRSFAMVLDRDAPPSAFEV